MEYKMAVIVPQEHACASPFPGKNVQLVVVNRNSANQDYSNRLRREAAQLGVKHFKDYLLLVLEVEFNSHVVWAVADVEDKEEAWAIAQQVLTDLCATANV